MLKALSAFIFSSHGTVGGEPVPPALLPHEQQDDGQPQVEKAPSTEP